MSGWHWMMADFIVKAVVVFFAICSGLLVHLYARDRIEALISSLDRKDDDSEELLRETGIPDCYIRKLLPIALILKPLLRVIRHCRMKRASGQLVDALVMMRGALSAGLSIQQALGVVATELGGPLGLEMAAAVNRVKLGATIEEALDSLSARVGSEDVELFVRSIEILRRSGGNMVECIDKLTETIESRMRVEEKVRSLTSQGIAQAVILLALPWFMAIALHILAPDFISPLFDTRLGHAILACVIMLETAGALWLRKIVRIRV